MKNVFRHLTRADWFQGAAGFLAAAFLRLVWRTNRFSFDPPDVYDVVEPEMPVILAFWHGQHFMTPFIKKTKHRAKVLISRHRDGEMNARAAERLGIGTVRGSGDHGSAFHRKGGVGAFREMVRALEENYNIALTADVPKRSRIAGMGIIMLARESGRPIMPFAMATSRFIRLDNWDGTTINLPFGRGALVGGEIGCCAVSPAIDKRVARAVRERVCEVALDFHRAGGTNAEIVEPGRKRVGIDPALPGEFRDIRFACFGLSGSSQILRAGGQGAFTPGRKLAAYLTHIAQPQRRLAGSGEAGLFPNHVVALVAVTRIRCAEIERDLLRFRRHRKLEPQLLL